MSKKNLYIGTSGWVYTHWKENFYPVKLSEKNYLNFYSSYFSTVEINSTFYRIPTEKTIKNWQLQVPNDFIFSLKANQYITHLKRLKEFPRTTTRFFETIALFGNNLGPILFQLPPSFKINLERFEEFIEQLPKKSLYVFEFRNPSWYIDKIYELLRKHNISLCITDLNGHLSPIEITSAFTYIRLHGPQKSYQGSYDKQALKKWKHRIEEFLSKNKKVFCYFDNDEKGYAIKDASTLKKMID